MNFIGLYYQMKSVVMKLILQGIQGIQEIQEIQEMQEIHQVEETIKH